MNEKWHQWFMGIASCLIVSLVFGLVSAYLDLRDLRKDFEDTEDHEQEFHALKADVAKIKSQSWWRDGKLRDHYNDTRPEGTSQVTWDGMPR